MQATDEKFDAIVIGAGAAGLFFAWEAARRGRRIIAIDHADKLGEKIRISGGGRCNFTNIHAKPENFISRNPKFCISALSAFSPNDFLERVSAANIAWHEKKLGQLFCDGSAQQIIDMLVSGCREEGVTLRTSVTVTSVDKTPNGFRVETDNGPLSAPSLVIATGGKSIPKIGATDFGYKLATKFGLAVVEPRPALVPLTFEGDIKEVAKGLSGVSIDASVACSPASAAEKRGRNYPPTFREGLLFTHRGLSGPSILQISSYWREGDLLAIDCAPACDIFRTLKSRRDARGKVAFQTALGEILPKRFAQKMCELEKWGGNLADWSDEKLKTAADKVHCWTIKPSGSEGYRTAEVTLGGVDTESLYSKTMEAKSVSGLFFIGETVDVTGWLGGYNFQWAWASAYAAAQAV
ncbi:MAG: NAD(P)/FAD-dependent oxidoreductase [Pseudomonadota bacterium]